MRRHFVSALIAARHAGVLFAQSLPIQPSSKPITVPCKEPIAILEVGTAASLDTANGAATFAPSLAAEVTPIERWLELEVGTAPFLSRSSTEWDTDLLFKKPWTLSRGAEVMFGIGPEWVAVRQRGKTTHTISGEIAGDFMFWPAPRHHYGWFLEPAWDRSFAPGHAQSVGITAGLLIGIPK